jgi:hypothetical protein
MRHLTGFVYVISGLLVMFVGMITIGAMLGMTTAILSISNLLVSSLITIGPSLLILTGVTAIIGQRRPKIWLIAAALLVILLVVWTLPRIGWRLSGWLIIAPAAVALLVSGLIVQALKKSWITAAIGSALTAPFFLFGSGQILYRYWFGSASFSLASIWLFVPAVLLMSCFALALSLRLA